MAWRPPQNPLDQPLVEAIAVSIASDLIDGSVNVLDRRDLARRAALGGFRQAMKLVMMVVGEMAADHGDKLLEEAVLQIRTLPKDAPWASRSPRPKARTTPNGRLRPNGHARKHSQARGAPSMDLLPSYLELYPLLLWIMALSSLAMPLVLWWSERR
jgi:hypothetical protein